jgi:hypothetical protein
MLNPNRVLAEKDVVRLPFKIFPALTGAALRVAKAAAAGEKIVVSALEQDRRLAICRGCEFFVKAKASCSKCGCYLNLKTRLETEHCPISRW